MAKKAEDIGQGATTDHSTSPYEVRRQLDPMSGQELEAFNWVIAQISERNKELSFRGLCDEGVDMDWLSIRDDGAIEVNTAGGIDFGPLNEDADEKQP